MDMNGTGKPACVKSNALIDEDNEIVDCQIFSSLADERVARF